MDAFALQSEKESLSSQPQLPSGEPTMRKAGHLLLFALRVPLNNIQIPDHQSSREDRGGGVCVWLAVWVGGRERNINNQGPISAKPLLQPEW